MAETHYGRGRKPVNDKYIAGMRVGQKRSIPCVTLKERAKMAAGIHAAAFRQEPKMSIETGYDAAGQVLNYRRIK